MQTVKGCKMLEDFYPEGNREALQKSDTIQLKFSKDHFGCWLRTVNVGKDEGGLTI